MRNPLKALAILCTIIVGASLISQFNPANSFASPGAVSKMYLPIVFRPPGPVYLPYTSRASPPTPTPTPVTPTPTSGVVGNGGFEDPNTASGPWTAIRIDRSTQPPTTEGIDVRTDKATLATAGVSPHTGNYASWLDSLDYEIYLQQQITLPVGTSTLSYWAWIKSDEPNCDTAQLDGAWVFFITTQQNQLESYSLCKPTATTGWVQRSLNVSGYAGQTGWLTFLVRNLGQPSHLFLDDVSAGTSASIPTGYERIVPASSVRTPIPASR